MLSRKKKIILSIGLVALLSGGCKKLTDDHNAVTDRSLKMNLMTLIESNPDLSLFAFYLRKTGLSTEVASSKLHTVFAPGNNLMKALDTSITKHLDRLKKYMENHVALKSYTTNAVAAETPVRMLGGKYNLMNGYNIGGATIIDGDHIASNGVLHIIDGILKPLENCWEFLENNAEAPAGQKAFMLSLFQNVFDTSNAVITGIDPNTGEPIYQPGTDSVFTNLIWNRIYDLRDESKQFTLFMLVDTAWNAEVDRYRPYYITGTADSTTLAASWNVVKDFAVDTLYEPGTIPDTILSKFETKVPVNNSSVVKTIRTSNGIVYIMSSLPVKPEDKFKPYIIETERYLSSSHDRRGNTYFRDRFNPLTGQNFSDVLVLGHGVAMFNLRYQISEVPSIKYKAYWMALNDFQTATFSQRIGIGTPTSALLNYTPVTPGNYDEVYIGEFTQSEYMPVMNIYLTAANSTSSAVNPLVCNYIRLEPVIP